MTALDGLYAMPGRAVTQTRKRTSDSLHLKRIVFVVCAVVLGLVIPVSGAHADPLSDALAQNPEPISYRKSAVTDPSGASAECVTNQDMDKITCAVTDTKADKNAVYVKWKGANGQSGQR